MERVDLVVIGLGTAGIVAAETAVSFGARVIAVERARIGGDCLWTGCVPSKALLATGRVAQVMRTADAFGVRAVEPEIDAARVFARIRAIQGRIAASDDSPERLRGEGIDVRFGTARIAGDHVVEIDGVAVQTRYVLVATGSRPAIPAGLEHALTTETIWDLDALPEALTVVGAGASGLELAQGFRRLGVPVTVLERERRLLPGEEPDLVDRLASRLRDEGVDVRLGADPAQVPGGTVLVAAGRDPNVEGLGLEEAGVEVGPKGVVVDAGMRTAAPWVYAAGDVAGRQRFTHTAGFEAVRAVRNMLFPLHDTSEPVVTWVTFTDPELAHAGLTAVQARERFGRRVEVHDRGLDRSDRARADGREEGAIRLVTHKGKLVGAHVLGDRAGDVIGELALAIDRGLKLSKVGAVIHAYPTTGTDVQLIGAEAAFAEARRLRFLTRVAR